MDRTGSRNVSRSSGGTDCSLSNTVGVTSMDCKSQSHGRSRTRSVGYRDRRWDLAAVRRERAIHLRSLGEPVSLIASRVGVSPRQVKRYLAAWRAAGGGTA